MLLYELLTGRTPFDRERLHEAGLDEVRRAIREEEPPRPSHRLSTLDAEALSTITAHRGVDARRLGRLLRGGRGWIGLKAVEKDQTLSGIDDRVSEDIAERAKLQTMTLATMG